MPCVQNNLFDETIVSVLTHENAAALVEFAQGHSSNEIDREVARLHAKAGREKMVTVQISLSTYEKLKRAGSLRAQMGKTEKLAETAAAVVDDFLVRHDPVKKAERSLAKKSAPKKLCVNRVNGRTPLTAKQRHQVNLRDRGRCTFRDTQGRRCDNERYLAIHHVHPVSLGGGNEPENLTTLCWQHHDLVHQQTLPLVGQTSWLRSRVRMYGS